MFSVPCLDQKFAEPFLIGRVQRAVKATWLVLCPHVLEVLLHDGTTALNVRPATAAGKLPGKGRQHAARIERHAHVTPGRDKEGDVVTARSARDRQGQLDLEGITTCGSDWHGPIRQKEEAGTHSLYAGTSCCVTQPVPAGEPPVSPQPAVGREIRHHRRI